MDSRTTHVDAGRLAVDLVASSVRGALEAAALTRHRAAELSGIPYSTLYRKCEGDGAFNSEELGRLAHVLGLALADLAGGRAA